MTVPHGARRFVVPTIVSPTAGAVTRHMAGEWGVSILECPVVGDRIALDPAEGDLLVRSVPDVFGRHLDPPPDWTVLRVMDSALGLEAEPGAVVYGRPPTVTTTEGSNRLRELWKPLCQQPNVRPVLAGPSPFGLPFVAPTGIDVPDDVTATLVAWPGLPDLVVVHHPSVTAWAAYDDVIESSEWT